MDSPPYPIVLCADDYGLSTGICDSIETLLIEKKLSAVSSIVVFPEWENRGSFLFGYKDTVDLGLHFYLIGPSKPTGMICHWQSYMNFCFSFLKDPPGVTKQVSSELKRQYEIFISITGCTPQFVDSHRFIHQLPGIIQPFIDFIEPLNVYTRNSKWSVEPTGHSLISNYKRLAMKVPGSFFCTRLKRTSIVTNNRFAGIRFLSSYNLDTLANELEVSIYNASRHDRTICMVHPGFLDDEIKKRDSYTSGRVGEHMYLSSYRFQNLLDRQEIKLTPFILTKDPF